MQPLDLADHSSMLKTYRVSLAQLSRNDQVRSLSHCHVCARSLWPRELSYHRR